MRNSPFFSAISYNFLTISGKVFLVGQRYGIYEAEDSGKEGRDGNRKGDRCMSRNDRRIKKWRSAGTLGELYLKEMAEQGLLLEDMTHLKYIFREDEPQHLRYRIEELEHVPTDEERAEYAKNYADYLFEHAGPAIMSWIMFLQRNAVRMSRRCRRKRCCGIWIKK